MIYIGFRVLSCDRTVSHSVQNPCENEVTLFIFLCDKVAPIHCYQMQEGPKGHIHRHGPLNIVDISDFYFFIPGSDINNKEWVI